MNTHPKPSRNFTQVAKDYFWPLFLVLVAISAFVGPKYFLLTYTWVPGMAVYVNSGRREKIKVSLAMLVFLVANGLYVVFAKDYPALPIYWLINKYLYIVVLGLVLTPIADWAIESISPDSWGFWLVLTPPFLLVLYVFTQLAAGHTAEGMRYTAMHLAEDGGFGVLVAVITAMFSSERLRIKV